LYTFASNSAYVVVLTQRVDPNIEILVSFVSSAFKGVELNYAPVEKQAFDVYKVVKHFISTLLNPSQRL